MSQLIFCSNKTITSNFLARQHGHNVAAVLRVPISGSNHAIQFLYSSVARSKQDVLSKNTKNSAQLCLKFFRSSEDEKNSVDPIFFFLNTMNFSGNYFKIYGID